VRNKRELITVLDFALREMECETTGGRKKRETPCSTGFRAISRLFRVDFAGARNSAKSCEIQTRNDNGSGFRAARNQREITGGQKAQETRASRDFARFRAPRNGVRNHRGGDSPNRDVRGFRVPPTYIPSVYMGGAKCTNPGELGREIQTRNNPIWEVAGVAGGGGGVGVEWRRMDLTRLGPWW